MRNLNLNLAIDLDLRITLTKLVKPTFKFTLQVLIEILFTILVKQSTSGWGQSILTRDKKKFPFILKLLNGPHIVKF